MVKHQLDRAFSKISLLHVLRLTGPPLHSLSAVFSFIGSIVVTFVVVASVIDSLLYLFLSNIL